jgi:serine/threonine protein kinase
MSAESRRVTNTEVWVGWERQIVNGVYPLRRFLGGSSHSAVFLTEYKGASPSDVAIKLVPADTLETEAQLVQWGTAATLSHPHLVSLFDVGRCQLEGRGFLFVVMEYAEQTLAQVLPKRALSPDEVRELLLPTLDVLAFLHRNQLVHSQVKPSNLLVVNDQLKLAADTVRPTGISMGGIARTTSLYDPPELKDGEVSAAGDVWGLGITLVEALTQRAPTWADDLSETASLLGNFPAPFVDAVRRCLTRNPANRPSVIELSNLYKPGSHQRVVSSQVSAPRASVPPVPTAEPPLAADEVAPSETPPKRNRLVPRIAAAVVISLAVWVGLRLRQQHLDAPQTASAASQLESAPTGASDVSASAGAASAAASEVSGSAGARSAGLSRRISRQPDQSSLPPESASSSAVHQVIPDVPQALLDKIRGHINVRVRVLVDPSGDVVGQFLESAGPSRYFARVAGDSAGEWKFAPADGGGPRVWLLRFEFTRHGATVDTTAAQ